MLAIQYLSHSDLYGVKGNPQTLRKKLRGVGRASVLSNLAVVNNLFAHADFFGNGYKDYPEIQRLLKSAYLRPELRQLIIRDGFNDRFIFARSVNLYLAQLAVLHSDDRRPVIVDGGTPGGFELGDCSLIAGDCLFSAEQERNSSTGSADKIIRHLGFQLGPSAEISNPLDMLRGIVRSEIIFSEIFNSADLEAAVGQEKLAKLQLASRFYERTGIEIVEYIDIIVALLAYFLVPDKMTGLGSIRSIQIEPFLAQSALRREALERFLELESSTVQELAERFKKQPTYLKQFSFVPFKSHPLIEIQSGLYFCIDTFFLSEKLNAGLYWKIFDLLDNKVRETFQEIYGHVFELYVRRVLRDTISEPRLDPRKGLLVSNPLYRNGNHSFDEVIYYPKTKHLIVIESKASFLQTTAKYGKSIKKFWVEIKQKFIEKPDGNPKGIGQLVRHIGNLFSRDRATRKHLADDSLDAWFQLAEIVSPVLVVQEPVLSFHINEGYLNKEFQKRLKLHELRASVRVQNLTVVNIETLELLRAHLSEGHVTLEQCVNYRTYRDRNYKSDFASLVSENFDLRNRTDEKTDSVCDTVFKRATGRLFSDVAIEGAKTGIPVT